MRATQEWLARPRVYDGAKGTLLLPHLLAAGRAASDATEWLNLLAPDAVRDVHRRYVDAGAGAIQTNTFQGNRFALELHGLGDRNRDVNRPGARLAGAAAGGSALVAGSVGPSGRLLATGDIDRSALVDAFAEQVSALADGGADFIHIETMFDLDEALAAVEGARAAAGLPIVLTFSFDRGDPEKGYRTLMGVSPGRVAEAVAELDLLAVGANCGRGLEGYERVLADLASTAPLVAKFNAGMPRVEAGRTVYDVAPPAMATYARRAAGLGARLVGVCCGSTPDHVAAIAAALAPMEGEAP
ncbi:MAG: homocysteine S-methyltransferase family protein [Chloroflexi bacterium]|nr:homocysteine S-methyltransferase family protein [Chloroflexota bacterium]